MAKSPDLSTWVRELMAQHQGALVRYAQHITCDLELARDAVQDTFLRLCSQDPGELAGRIAPWLFTVCRNRALDLKRKERRMKPLEDAHLAVPIESEDAPPQRAEKRQEMANVLRVINQLPTNQQEVVRLKFQNNLSYKEISDVTGLSVSNVGFILHTAIRAMRKQLTATSVAKAGE
jgi:RNA polymerase sigma factor (sigma-70 family)